MKTREIIKKMKTWCLSIYLSHTI